MTDKVLVSNGSNTSPDTIESFYESPPLGLGTRIKAFTASNSGSTSYTYKGYIYDSTGAMVSAVIPQTIVVLDRADNGPSIINQLIPAGGSLRMETSEANQLNFYVTGLDQ